MSRLAALTFAIGTATAMAAPSGRVVRVERAGGGGGGAAPRLCELRGEVGTCIGDEPKPGQTVIVLDERHVVAKLHSTSAARRMRHRLARGSAGGQFSRGRPRRTWYRYAHMFRDPHCRS